MSTLLRNFWYRKIKVAVGTENIVCIIECTVTYWEPARLIVRCPGRYDIGHKAAVVSATYSLILYMEARSYFA